MKKLSLLHYVSLDGAGGVELQFADFVNRAAHYSRRTQTVVACGRRIHPLVRQTMSADSNTVYEKYAGAFKIPKWPPALRAGRQRRLLARHRPDAVVIWNRLRDSVNTLAAAGSERCVYWERGASWFADETPAKTWFLSHVRAALCNSHAARRMLELRWSFEGQTRIVPNALRPALAVADAMPRSAAGDPACWQLGLVARLESIKGVAVALHALVALSARHRAILHIAGDGPERERMRSLAQRLGIDHAVRFHGLVADMGRFYRRIDLLVHPAMREPFGQVVIEANAYGVPAVVTAVDGLVEVVADGETGQCIAPTLDLSSYADLGGDAPALPPYVYDPALDVITAPRAIEPQRLADAIESLLTDPERYAGFSRAALTRVSDAFSFDRHVERALTAIGAFVTTGRLDGS